MNNSKNKRTKCQMSNQSECKICGELYHTNITVWIVMGGYHKRINGYKKHKRKCRGHKLDDTQCPKCHNWFSHIKRHKCRAGNCVACGEHTNNTRLHMDRKHKYYKPIKKCNLFPDVISGIIAGYVPDPEIIWMCTGCGIQTEETTHGCIDGANTIKIDKSLQEDYRKLKQEQFANLTIIPLP